MTKLLVLTVIAMLAAGCGQVELYSNLPEQEANEMMAILMQDGIACSKSAGEEGTWNLSVSEDGFSRAVAQLKDQGYPHDKFVGIGDVFQKSGLVSSPTEERIRFMHALSQELSETISRIDGVLTARVHIVLPNNSPFGEKVEPSSASVFIKHHPDADLESSLPDIKELVLNSIEGLEFDKVATVLVPADASMATAPAKGPEYVELLTVQVAPQSVQNFWKIVGGLGAVAGVAVLCLLGMLWRSRSPAAPRMAV